MGSINYTLRKKKYWILLIKNVVGILLKSISKPTQRKDSFILICWEREFRFILLHQLPLTSQYFEIIVIHQSFY